MVLHRSRLEGNRERLAVGSVPVKIHQHQSAREEIVEHRPPTLLAGKYLVLVEHHQFGGIGAEQHDILLAETEGAINRTIAFEHILAETNRVLEHLQRRTQYRQALFAGNMRQLLLARWLHPMRVSGFLIGIAMRFCGNCRQGKAPELWFPMLDSYFHECQQGPPFMRYSIAP